MTEDQQPYQPFQSEEEGAPIGSLSDYISRRLQQRTAPAMETPEPPQPGVVYYESELYKQQMKSLRSGGAGPILNRTDTQLVNDHLEQYVPQAETRYQMMRERIAAELNAIYQDLQHYKQFHGVEYRDKIQALEDRARLLQRKVFELDQKLTRLNPLQAMYHNLQKFVPQSSKPRTGPKGSFWSIIPNTHGRLRDEMSQMGNELEAIQHILEEQIHEPSLSPEQLSRLINEYDTLLKAAERCALDLKNRKTLARQLNDKLSHWYRQGKAQLS